MELTDEQKVKIFDALVKEFQGREKCIGVYNVPVSPTTPYKTTVSTSPVTVKYREVGIYEWTIRSNGCSDFAEALRLMLPTERK